MSGVEDIPFGRAAPKLFLPCRVGGRRETKKLLNVRSEHRYLVPNADIPVHVVLDYQCCLLPALQKVLKCVEVAEPCSCATFGDRGFLV